MTLPVLGIPGTLCDGRLFSALPQVRDAGRVRDADIGRAAERFAATAPDTFVALGFSLGCFVVMEAMRVVPKRMRGAILISGNARPDVPANASSRRAQVDLARREGAGAVIDGLWNDYVAADAADRGDLRSLLREMADDTPLDDFAAQAELAIGRPDSRLTLRLIDMPTLILHGDEDRLCPVDRQIEMADLAARARRVAIAGAGHFAPIERPAEVAAEIARWLHEIEA